MIEYDDTEKPIESLGDKIGCADVFLSTAQNNLSDTSDDLFPYSEDVERSGIVEKIFGSEPPKFI